MRVHRIAESDLLGELKAKTNRKFGLTETAREYGMTPQFISDVIYGRRGMTERLAEAMGYRRVIEFEKP